MGIKVEHQGSATSRIVGANVGGNAKARQERSLEMKRTAAVENAAANRQLDGARATGATPGHATAQLGHAQVGGGGGKGGGTKGATAATTPATATTPRRKYLGEAVYHAPEWNEMAHASIGGGLRPPEGATGYDQDKGQFYRDYEQGEEYADALARKFAVERDHTFNTNINNRRIEIAAKPTVGSPIPTPAGNPNDATGAAPQVWGLTEEGKAFDAILKKKMADKKAKLEEMIAKKSRGVLGAAGETPSVGAATPDATLLAFKPPEAPAAQKPFKIPGFSEALDLAGVYDVGGKLFGQGGALGNASGVDYNSSTEDIFQSWYLQ